MGSLRSLLSQSKTQPIRINTAKIVFARDIINGLPCYSFDYMGWCCKLIVSRRKNSWDIFTVLFLGSTFPLGAKNRDLLMHDAAWIGSYYVLGKSYESGPPFIEEMSRYNADLTLSLLAEMFQLGQFSDKKILNSYFSVLKTKYGYSKIEDCL